jgi:hypothetical protein
MKNGLFSKTKKDKKREKKQSQKTKKKEEATGTEPIHDRINPFRCRLGNS